MTMVMRSWFCFIQLSEKRKITLLVETLVGEAEPPSQFTEPHIYTSLRISERVSARWEKDQAVAWVGRWQVSARSNPLPDLPGLFQMAPIFHDAKPLILTAWSPAISGTKGSAHVANTDVAGRISMWRGGGGQSDVSTCLFFCGGSSLQYLEENR